MIQLYRPNKNDHASPIENDFLEITNPPREVKRLFKKACYDCHSNKTNYAFFDNVAPISWWVDHTISEAKISINFSEWKQTDPQKKLSFLSASVFDIKTDKMPTDLYLKMHPSARLAPKEKEKIITWIEAINKFDPQYNINQH